MAATQGRIGLLCPATDLVWGDAIRRMQEQNAKQEELDRARKQFWPGLVLQEVGGEGRTIPPGFRMRDPLPIELDGSYEIDGLPAGTWEVFLRNRVELPAECLRRGILPRHSIGVVQVLDGETTAVRWRIVRGLMHRRCLLWLLPAVFIVAP